MTTRFSRFYLLIFFLLGGLCACQRRLPQVEGTLPIPERWSDDEMESAEEVLAFDDWLSSGPKELPGEQRANRVALGHCVGVSATFSGTGYPEEVTLDTLGRYLTSARILVVRLNANQELDTSFGTGPLTQPGQATNSYHSSLAIRGIALNTLGNILSAERIITGNSADVRLTRLVSNGTLDTSFGTGATSTFDLSRGRSDLVRAMKPGADGKLYLAGYGLSSSDLDPWVARINTNGSLDTTFATIGFVWQSSAAVEDAAVTLSVGSEEKPIIGGFRRLGIGQRAMPMMIRYNSNGTLDTSFNTVGIWNLTIGTRGDSLLTRIEVDSLNRYVVAGHYQAGISFLFLTRLHSSGAYDTSFSTTGLNAMTHSEVQGSQPWPSLAFQTNGKTNIGYTNKIIRIASNGQFLTSFNHGNLLRDLAIDTAGTLWSNDASTNCTVNFDNALLRLYETTSGAVAREADFSFSALAGGKSRSLTLQNMSDTVVANFTTTTIGALPFKFAGGSYPGTGGSCASSLATSISCTLVVALDTSTAGAKTSSIVVQYNNGNSEAVASRSLKAVYSGLTHDLSDPQTVAPNQACTTVGTELTATLTNNTGVTINVLTNASSLSYFAYVGGSFPGNAGTCGGQLNNSATCTLKLYSLPQASALNGIDQLIVKESDTVGVAVTLEMSSENDDDDSDTFTECDGDCNDGSAAIKPTAIEDCDNAIDDDCDGSTDTDADRCFDDDGDTYTEEAGDCDDTNVAKYPGATEVCNNGIDEDCSSAADDGTCTTDGDSDGYTENGGDCDDANAAISPGVTESCANATDDNCDGNIDTDPNPCGDDDGDGYNEANGDCDDVNNAVSPGASENPCDSTDNNCSGTTDENATDSDADGYKAECGDCDDGNASVYPGNGCR